MIHHGISKVAFEDHHIRQQTILTAHIGALGIFEALEALEAALCEC